MRTPAPQRVTLSRQFTATRWGHRGGAGHMHTPSCRTSPFSRRAHPRPCAQLPHVLQPLHRAHPWPRVGTCHTPRGRTAAASPRQVGVCHRAGAPRLAQAAAGQLSPDRRSAAGSRNEAGGHDQPLSRRQRTAGGGVVRPRRPWDPNAHSPRSGEGHAERPISRGRGPPPPRRGTVGPAAAWLREAGRWGSGRADPRRAPQTGQSPPENGDHPCG